MSTHRRVKKLAATGGTVATKEEAERGLDSREPLHRRTRRDISLFAPSRRRQLSKPLRQACSAWPAFGRHRRSREIPTCQSGTCERLACRDLARPPAARSAARRTRATAASISAAFVPPGPAAAPPSYT